MRQAAVHEVVDIGHWKAMFPLTQFREEARQRVLAHWQQYPAAYVTEAAFEKDVVRQGPQAQAITSPYHLAILEQLREEALASGVRPKRRVPTDVFVFSQGEPDRREVTKVSGLPYWPAGRSWPCSEENRPLTFVAQFCFADSRDIVGDLPGDILLIFFDYECKAMDEKQALRFEWMRMGETSLIEQSGIPKTGTTVASCYGAIHRTFDCPGMEEGHRLWELEGTKIGGVPAWIQGSVWPWRRFLCACGSIQPAFGQPYPYLNVPEPRLTFSWTEDENELMWGDAGSLYIFRGPFNTVRGTVQFY